MKKKKTSIIYNCLGDVPEEIKETITRVGVIPYSKNSNGDVFFGFCIDLMSGEGTDCGGFKTKTMSIIDCAIQELREESIEIFNYSREDIEKFPLVTNGKTCIFFGNSQTFNDIDDLPKCYYEYRKTKQRQLNKMHFRGVSLDIIKKHQCYLENSLMFWISSSDLIKLVKQSSKKTSVEQRFYQLGFSIKESSIPMKSFYMNTYMNIYNHPVLYDKVRKLLRFTIKDVIKFHV